MLKIVIDDNVNGSKNMYFGHILNDVKCIRFGVNSLNHTKAIAWGFSRGLEKNWLTKNLL